MNNNSSREVARRREGGEDPEDNGPSWWAVGLGVAAGVAALAGGIYMASQQQERQQQHPSTSDSDTDQSEESEDDSDGIEFVGDDTVSQRDLHSRPCVNNLNSLLQDIYVRYIAVKKEQFALRYKIFENVFKKLHKSMKAVDPYYERYSSRLQFRSEKFSMHITIRLPVNMFEDAWYPEKSDIVIERGCTGFVQLRAGPQYIKLPQREDFSINKHAYFWLDENKYILKTKFMAWFQSLVDRALNRFQKQMTIDGIQHAITTASNGAAYTLWITNSAGFRLSVDLVPMLRFPEERWLGSSKAYRDIPADCNVGSWFVFPKFNQCANSGTDNLRSWHIDMFDQERKMLHNSFHLRQGIRLLQKLRDARKMIHIKNYHIKTLFMLKSIEMSPSFWQRDVATVFKVMLQELLNALVNEKITSFWAKSHNMLGNIPSHILKGYANKLQILVTGLEDDSNYMLAAKYILTDVEYAEYERRLKSTYY